MRYQGISAISTLQEPLLAGDGERALELARWLRGDQDAGEISETMRLFGLGGTRYFFLGDAERDGGGINFQDLGDWKCDPNEPRHV